jgi:type I restriction enzyme S subunit
MFPAGSVIVSSRAPIGYVAIAGQPMCTNQGCKTAVPPDFIDSRYLYWYMLKAKPDLENRASGTTFREISGKGFGETELVWPGLDEQRRIVDILEDHLSRLDAARSGCSASLSRLEVLRISALSAHLFGREEWPRVPLGDALDLSIGGLWGNEPGSDELDVRVLRVTELKRHGRLDPSTAATRSIALRHATKRQLRAGDLLLEKSGGGPTSPVGRVGLVEALDAVSICSNFMQLMRPRVDQIAPRFLHLYLHAFHLRGGTAAMQKATTNIRNLKASQYLQIHVPLPDLDTQVTVVQQLDDALGGADRLEAGIKQTMSRGVALRRALLNAAFSGYLTGRSSDMEMVEEMADV